VKNTQRALGPTTLLSFHQASIIMWASRALFSLTGGRRLMTNYLAEAAISAIASLVFHPPHPPAPSTLSPSRSPAKVIIQNRRRVLCGNIILIPAGIKINDAESGGGGAGVSVGSPFLLYLV